MVTFYPMYMYSIVEIYESHFTLSPVQSHPITKPDARDTSNHQRKATTSVRFGPQSYGRYSSCVGPPASILLASLLP